jgi:hypothetical protein
MQKWEYKYLYRHRGTKPSSSGYIDADEWSPNVSWAEIEALGRDGWELVVVTCLSSQGGSVWSEPFWEHPTSSAAINTRGPMVAGVTTDQIFYFKRPISEPRRTA